MAINAGPDSSFEYDKDASAGYVTVSGGTIGPPSTQAIDTSGVADPAPQSVYQSERYGNFTYTIQPPFHPGASYLVRLHFAETYSGVNAEGQRIISVAINGRQVLTNFDLYAAAGHVLYKAVVEQFNVTADSLGKIVIAVTGGGNYGAKLSGLQILPNAVTKFDLSGYFNEVGISSDAHPSAGGLDGSGNSVSSDAAGTTITWNSFDFNLGSPDQLDGLGNAVKNSIKATGQSITLPGGNYSSIRLIGTATNGSQTGTFTVHYDDGSTATFAQTFSDWFVGPLPLGETIARRMAYRNTSSGQQTGPFYLYGYTFILDPTKAVSSIDLPNNANMHIFALDLVQ
ncbi:MAG: malectin domain-containing carbohydrate-binding protein [Isosphaeraceae bacterium]